MKFLKIYLHEESWKSHSSRRAAAVPSLHRAATNSVVELQNTSANTSFYLEEIDDLMTSAREDDCNETELGKLKWMASAISKNNLSLVLIVLFTEDSSQSSLSLSEMLTMDSFFSSLLVIPIFPSSSRAFLVKINLNYPFFYTRFFLIE